MAKRKQKWTEEGLKRFKKGESTPKKEKLIKQIEKVLIEKKTSSN